MKKIVVSIFVIGALVFSSCKSEKKDVKEVVVETEAVVNEELELVEEEEIEEEVSKELTSAVEGVTIPSFSNEAVTQNLLGYAQYAKNYIEANGDFVKITGMASKGVSLLKEGKELTSGLDKSEVEKYKSVLAAIQSKMAAAN
ncbi:hypothetical protein H0I29_10085 [Polaribacter sp. R2A056_3_33]|jgi:hypothetical protein|uniref:hypothetical protein n=1 Tax=unclassified Polaribacter TaxID=196858 RepID=UPI001C4F6682|nr:hypothetical protein [Polaribacter sp. R2A056_3_33]QXP68992.1 hypothetical protein H0I29_10085 [Polaribacter sp. R2A056_3_33]